MISFIFSNIIILLHTLISLILKVYILLMSSVKFSCKITSILYETIHNYASLSLPFRASFTKHFHIILYTLYQLRFSQNLHILNTNYSDFYHSLICFFSYNYKSYRKKGGQYFDRSKTSDQKIWHAARCR